MPTRHLSPIKTILHRAGAALCLVACGAGETAVAQGLERLAETEVQRRSALVAEADAQVREGYLLLNAGKHQEAAALFAAAHRSLPVSPMAAPARVQARDGYATASMVWARELLKDGRRVEAEGLLKSVLAPEMDPENQEAQKLLAQLQDSERHPPALTPQHVQNTRQVQEWLAHADSKLELGDFDSATSYYTRVLRVDAYNTAARRGLERADQHRAQYYDTTRDHNRIRMLNEVNRQWEDQVPPSLQELASYSEARSDSLRNTMGGREKIVQKLRTMVVPKVDFSGASLAEVVEFLRVRSRDLDPEGRGVDFVLNLPPETTATNIDLALTNIPMEELIRYCAEKAGAAYKVDDFAVKFVSLTERSSELFSRSYRVPPGFIENAPADAAAPGANDPFATPAPAAGGTGIRRLTAREFLEARGVTFPDGAMANYNTFSNRLMVRNTAQNLEIIEALVEAASSSSPKQALITVKWIEVNQTNLEEMGFDWLLGQFNVPGSEGVFASGGTGGNMQPGDGPSTNFPLKFPGTDVPVGQFPVTSGLRSSGEILGRPTLSSILGENKVAIPVNTRSPGQFALSGVLTDPQFQVVVRAISQKKSVDLLAMPSIVTKGGQKATIDLAREFIYPTEFDPPEVPQQVGFVPGTNLPTGNSSAPITPSTPTTFEMRKVGTVIEMEPVISENGQEVELLVTPESTEFEGFIDYASDINNIMSSGGSSFSQPVDNRIIQPIFRTNKLTTAVKVYDGSTVVLGGVLEERRVKVEDKVPVVGNIPIVGRFWKSQVDQVEKKAYVVFVTVRVLDPSGQPLRAAQASASVGQ